MNKQSLAEEIARTRNCTDREARIWINAVFSTIESQLVEGKEVTIVGFGKFEPCLRRARLGVDPRRPAIKISMDAIYIPKFRAGKHLKDALKKKPV